MLAVLVFVPLGRGMDLGDRLNLEPSATFDHALELGPRSLSFWLMIGNIAAFVPLGLLLPMILRSRRSLPLRSWQIRALGVEAIDDAEVLVRRDRQGFLPAVATALLQRRLTAGRSY